MNNIDFLPERIKRRYARRASIVRQSYLLVACAIGLVALGYVRHDRVRGALVELAMLEERVAGCDSQLAMLDTLERQRAELLIIQRIEEHLGSRVRVIDILGELETLLTPSMTLTDLSVETTGRIVAVKPVGGYHNMSTSVVESADRRGRTLSVKRLRLTLIGLASSDVDVANFIGQLSASSLFDDVKMGYARSLQTDALKARQFQASCLVVR